MSAMLELAAPATGRVLGWAIAGVEVVTAGRLLCEVLGEDGGRHELRAPVAGQVRQAANRGATVEAGARLATLYPSQPVERATAPYSAPQPPTARYSGRPAPSPSSAAPEARHSAPQPPTARAAPVMEELTMPRKKAAPAPAPSPSPSVEGKRTLHATFHITPSQQARLKRRVLELKLEGGELASVGESEALRAALELLLELPAPALAAVLKQNRERERAGKYGAGWPRPSRK